ncbi:MAG: GNAT family N-acetyltransferase [Woeseiaceae bacterium]
MSETTFRLAAKADLPGIIAMLADDELGHEREDSSVPLNRKYIDAFAAIEQDPNQYLAVVEEDGALAGCLQLTFVPGLSRMGAWRGQIESVRIASGSRGKGLGRKMFEWAIAECRKRECGLVQLTSDKTRKDALKFYESLGFSATHEGMKLIL